MVKLKSQTDHLRPSVATVCCVQRPHPFGVLNDHPKIKTTLSMRSCGGGGLAAAAASDNLSCTIVERGH